MKKSIYALKIIKVEFLKLHILKMTLSDQSEYTVNLAEDFSNIQVFPKDQNEWSKGKIGEGNFSIEWPGGFDVHFDHIIELSKHQKISA